MSREAVLREAYAQALASETAGRLREAQELYGAILAADPTHVDALWRSAAVAGGLGRRDLSVRALELAAQLDPRRADVQNDLALALLCEDRIDDAAAACERALALDPHRIDTRTNLAAIERARGRYDRAALWCRDALRLDPGARDARLNLAGALAEIGPAQPAIDVLDELLATDPGDARARWNRALVCLFDGRLPQGWRDFGARWHSPGFAGGARPHRQRAWRGEPGKGRLLVWREQGVGDEILYASMLPDLLVCSRPVTLECEPRLLALFERSFPGAEVVPACDPPHPATTATDIDAQVALGDLAPILRPTVASFPDRRRSLVADPLRVDAWRERLRAAGPRPWVGVCWRSNNLRGERRLACLRIDELAPVLRVPGATLVNLQYDDCGPELAVAAGLCGRPLVQFDDLDMHDDLDGTAALIAALDLVVCASTTVSTLAGALGTPVWQFASGVDWHSLGTAHMPWQPSVRRFYRRWDCGWDPLVATVASRLARFAAAGAPWNALATPE